MTLNELKSLIGAEIRKRRIYLGFKQRELAEKIGVSRAWWTMMENHTPPLQLDTLLKICSVLDCTLADFFNSIYGLKKLPEEEMEEEVRDVVTSALSKKGFSADVTVILRHNP